MANRFTVLVPTADGEESAIDGVEFAAKLWLIPDWGGPLDPKLPAPVRGIRMDGLDYWELSEGTARFRLSDPIPKPVLEGRTPPEEPDEYEIGSLPRAALTALEPR